MPHFRQRTACAALLAGLALAGTTPAAAQDPLPRPAGTPSITAQGGTSSVP